MKKLTLKLASAFPGHDAEWREDCEQEILRRLWPAEVRVLVALPDPDFRAKLWHRLENPEDRLI